MLNLKNALREVNPDFSHVVKVTTFLKNRSDIVAFRAVREEFTKDQHLPAVSAVQVASLVRDELLLEIEAIVASDA